MSFRKAMSGVQRFSVSDTPTIGVLALQGAFDVHARRLADLGATTTLIRKPDQLAALDALVIPGGESTTFLKHLERAGFYDTLDAFVHTKPVFGTCAGCILLAKEVSNPPQKSFAVLDIAVERNAYGRQNDSAILTSETSLPGGPLEMVFIRAPRITRTGPDVETLATRDNTPTLIRQGRLLATTFHPELTGDTRVHQLFLNIVREEMK
jgi:pyridoxal 5'-phosphate synthase pdxT subunit